MTDYFLKLIESMHGPFGYLILGVCGFVENVVPPIPGDTVTVFGGYLVGLGRLTMAGTVIATTIGSFAGFMCMYALGRMLEKKFFEERNFSFFPKESLNKVTGWFERFGYNVVLANRFLSGARSVISLCAGVTQLHAGKVALLSLISCIVWNWALIYAGSKVGENWGLILEYLKKYNTVVVILIAAAAVWWGVRKVGERRRRGKSELK